jgi:hypothetical protein
MLRRIILNTEYFICFGLGLDYNIAPDACQEYARV